MSDPTLKCVIAVSPWRNLRALVGDTLCDRVPDGELIGVGDDSYIVNTEASTADVRGWLSEVLEPDEIALVIEFEKWSGYGSLDSAWLTRHGH